MDGLVGSRGHRLPSLDLYRRAELKDLERKEAAEHAKLEKENEAHGNVLGVGQVLLNKLTSRQETRQQRKQVLPENWQLLSHKAQGECQLRSGQERAPATYNFTLEFRVFEDQWTATWSDGNQATYHQKGQIALEASAPKVGATAYEQQGRQTYHFGTLTVDPCPEMDPTWVIWGAAIDIGPPGALREISLTKGPPE
eukprot:Skav203915  [mRNA]  locus=scaffold228:276060:294550:- [translate_table: standard]